MAFTGSTVWEVQSGGSDTANGGGFDTGVAGFPTDGTVDTNTGNTSAPVFSSASYNFVAGDVGAWLFVKSGTNSIPGWYKITSVASNKATLNAAIGAGVLFGSTSNILGLPNTAAGIATVGTPTNLTWGIDFSQSTTPIITYTDLVIGGTTTQFTSAGNPVNKRLIGNIIAITSGTGFTVQRVAVVSTSGTTATCDKSLGTGGSTGGNGKLGGCLASPGQAGALYVAKNFIYVKTASYSITSASTNVSGGCVSLAASSGGSEGRIEGYNTTRGDCLARSLTRPTLTASGISTFTLIALAGQKIKVNNFILDGASLTSSRGVANTTNASGTAYNVKAQNCTNGGIATLQAVYCEATGCATVAAIGSPDAFACWSHDNTISGFAPSGTFSSDNKFFFCVASNNTGASSDGFALVSSNAIVLLNNIAYTNGRHGFFLSNAAAPQSTIVNNIAYGNTGTGFNVDTPGALYLNNAYRSNGTNIVANAFNIGGITLTADPFVNAAGNNFALNSDAGGGGLLRSVGLPGDFPGGNSTGYMDIGPFQANPLVPLARVFAGL